MAETTETLRRLATNLRWSWHSPTRRLLDALPGATVGVHPLATLDALDADALAAFAADHDDEILALGAQLDEVVDAVAPPAIAYFSPEFGIAAEVPQYSGGLGILAGDHLKSASDLALPLVGVGLLYRKGFFRQSISNGTQHERMPTLDPEGMGAVDTGVTIDVAVAGADVRARVWQQMVGATPLVLLDTDIAPNTRKQRAITDRLYSGDRRHRLDQELVLGIGGVRALRALGIDPEVFHLNEGHACFLLLELLHEHIEQGLTPDDAVEAVRAATLFTTHTPVPAGIDRFDRALVATELGPWASELGVPVDTVLDWGTLPSDEPGKTGLPFNTAALAFELCGRANGVSQLHAEVSRDLFAELPRAATVTGITNGVHARTWVTPPLQALYDRDLGPAWESGDHDAWSRVDELDRDAFDAIRADGRKALIDLVAHTTGTTLEPSGCIIGFARRFATYKRAALLLRDPVGLQACLDAGAQFVFAGKAHPADEAGKAVLAEIVAFAESDASRGQLVLVPDYDIHIAQAMYGGCDVWLNNPVRPREACGTSGEKAALNGGLNCSILDGWWADWFTDGIGWAIPTSDADDPDERDDAEAAALHELLTTEVLTRFDRPADWWTMVCAMLRHLGPLVTATRMVAEYDQRFYEPIRKP